jgi:hypothetical protein
METHHRECADLVAGFVDDVAAGAFRDPGQ